MEGSEQATPTFKQQVALDAETGRRPLDAERARVLYKCTDCQATVDACRHRIDVSSSLRAARAVAVEQGVAPPEVAALRERFDAHGSPYAQDLGAAAAEALRRDPLPTDGTLGLFPGCTALARLPGEVRAAAAALRRLDQAPALALSNPVCCGYPLDAAGLDEAFELHARRVAASLSRFRRVTCLSPACAWTLAVRYREVGVEPPVAAAPLVDLLAAQAPRIRELARSAPPPQQRHAYRDPCFLGRRLRRTEEPRAALEAALGAPPLELGYARGDTICSGGGGVYPLTHPEEAKGCARRVADLVRETAPDVLVTACPSDRQSLERAETGLTIKSLVEVVAERIGA